MDQINFTLILDVCFILYDKQTKINTIYTNYVLIGLDVAHLNCVQWMIDIWEALIKSLNCQIVDKWKAKSIQIISNHDGSMMRAIIGTGWVICALVTLKLLHRSICGPP